MPGLSTTIVGSSTDSGATSISANRSVCAKDEVGRGATFSYRSGAAWATTRRSAIA
ncbi:Uncharacterised protein [Mycobacteroides abscessus subsp. abscessus]|nr:Uncharacterised protein [Mycobacteroides abscessus subsp. abscessus]SHY74779.1 Uncharacterised protein [Mycobacteroides abscessus subsp. abscessus]SKS72241.1 Uncharacterised protein [Mycobacteroides abscessus subsp. abscessus]SKU06264.1 Uncharacterised protein [Mycobacteroides abscessus subsp. abscessus]